MYHAVPLQVADVSHRFGAHVVLSDIRITVEPRTIVGLLGMNGAGKTTLLKIMLDMLRPERGTVTLFGRPPSDPSARRQVVFLPEHCVPPPMLTGEAYVRYHMGLFGKRYDPAEAAACAAAVDLNPAMLSAPIRRYSKGTAQKLGLACVLLIRAPLMILDEPMSGLDPSARYAVKRALRAAAAEGAAVLFSSHLLADVAEMCHRTIVLHQGKVHYDGTPDALIKAQDAATLEEAFLRTIGMDV